MGREMTAQFTKKTNSLSFLSDFYFVEVLAVYGNVTNRKPFSIFFPCKTHGSESDSIADCVSNHRIGLWHDRLLWF